MIENLIEMSYQFRRFIADYNKALLSPIKEDIKKDVLDRLSKSQFIYVMCEEGYILLRFDVDKRFNPSKTIYICQVFVKKEFRNKGIGKKLLDSIDKIPKLKGLKIFVNVNMLNPAIAFYFKEGYKLNSMELMKDD